MWCVFLIALKITISKSFFPFSRFSFSWWTTITWHVYLSNILRNNVSTCGCQRRFGGSLGMKMLCDWQWLGVMHGLESSRCTTTVRSSWKFLPAIRCRLKMYTLTCSTSHQIQQVSAQNSGESCALDTRQRSVLTVLSAIKIGSRCHHHEWLFVRVAGSVHEGSSRNVGRSR